jgi:hypothetical protein
MKYTIIILIYIVTEINFSCILFWQNRHRVVIIKEAMKYRNKITFKLQRVGNHFTRFCFIDSERGEDKLLLLQVLIYEFTAIWRPRVFLLPLALDEPKTLFFCNKCSPIRIRVKYSICVHRKFDVDLLLPW